MNRVQALMELHLCVMKSWHCASYDAQVTVQTKNNTAPQRSLKIFYAKALRLSCGGCGNFVVTTTGSKVTAYKQVCSRLSRVANRPEFSGAVLAFE